MPSEKVSLATIAYEAQVSQATVSKVLNGRSGVSEITRKRVESLLTEYGYKKPLATTKTSQTIELIMTEVSNNGTMAMIQETTAYAKNFSIGITCSCVGSSADDRYAEAVSSCLRGAIDRNPLGVILLLHHLSAEDKALLNSRDIPYVIIDPIGQVDEDTLGVGIDNWTSGLVVAEYLLSLGHTRIGIITGPDDAQSSQARLSGYMSALRTHGVSVKPDLIKPGDYLPDKAFHAACELLDLPEDERPTAIFAFNDLSAVSVYRAARARHILLPDELSVVGFDNVYPSSYVYPALTTVTQPFDRMAQRAIDLILDARADRSMQHYSILPTQLEIRQSCAAPRA
ncbi:LacI family DNA-binding transcriptional regulator [Alloscardovia macacae]|uniref:LacI family transcriptional regulator n=1 Tax=Alloscardovia macacae TaxID=1160091 RepID=A0A261F5E0_9BIFI|nr:substrate-binding domain-containing protein [Alloscardovia macacae]OZG54332.1 LacI family transcriptional regulator [Alloscardovia macacae]